MGVKSCSFKKGLNSSDFIHIFKIIVDSILDSPSSNEATEGLETAVRGSYRNDDAAYESADYVIGISTKDKSAIYTSLKEDREPDNFYQSLQTPRHE